MYDKLYKQKCFDDISGTLLKCMSEKANQHVPPVAIMLKCDQSEFFAFEQHIKEHPKIVSNAVCDGIKLKIKWKPGRATPNVPRPELDIDVFPPQNIKDTNRLFQVNFTETKKKTGKRYFIAQSV